MIIGALVGAADDGDDEIGILPDLRIADRGLQHIAVILDPLAEVEGQSIGQHGRYPFMGARGMKAVALISISRWGWGSWWTAIVVRAGPASSKYSA